MRWYWESSHYRKELGDLVLDRIFDYRDPQSGATWSGRGLTPKWLAEKEKAGAKREEFLMVLTVLSWISKIASNPR